MFHPLNRAGRRGTSLRAAAFGMAAATAGLALAEDPPKPEDVPFWAVGKPKDNKLAPVPSFPIPTPADQLQVGKFKLPPGFMAEVLSGFVENNSYLGRPVDILQLKDGSLLVSDDHAGAIYRISYSGK